MRPNLFSSGEEVSSAENYCIKVLLEPARQHCPVSRIRERSCFICLGSKLTFLLVIMSAYLLLIPVWIRGVMIPALDLDPESYFGNSGSGFR